MEKGIRIGWASRHIPLPAQRAEFDRLFGDWELVPLRGSLPQGGYSNAEEVLDLIKHHRLDYAVVVLPLSFISHLLTLLHREKVNCVLLWAQMELVEGAFDPERDVIAPGGRHYRFVEFRRIVELRLITEPLKGGKL